MLLLKSCPKCKGDVVEERDYYGTYTQCLQCGYLRDVQPVIKARKASRKRQEREALAAAS